MRVTAFRGETSVDAIAEKVYADLTPVSRKKAVAALLKENPQLERLEKVKPGSVLRIPEVPGVRATPGRGSEGAADEIADMLADRLNTYGRRLTARNEAFIVDIDKQAALLKDRQLQKTFDSSPVAKELSRRANQAIEADKKAVADTRKRLEAAIEKLTSDLRKR
jgi:hypothetical protein